MKRLLVVGLSALCLCLQALASDAVFEAGIVGGAYTAVKTSDAGAVTSGATTVAGGIADYVAADVSVNAWLVRAEVEGSYTRLNDQSRLELLVSGHLFPIFELHELFIRRGDLDGNEMRVMAGLGGSMGLPAGLGRIALGAGFMAVNWQRPNGPQQSIPYAGYAGGTLSLRIWKFQNELRVAYYLAPQFTQDYQNAIINHTSVIQSLQKGFIGADRLYFEAFKLPMTTFGPELRAQITQLPDGTEFLATVGFAGRFSPF